MPTDRIALAHRADFAGRHLVVLGAGMAGRSALAALLSLGAQVTLVTDGPPPDGLDERARLRSGADLVDADWQECAALVVSPGVPPTHPMVIAAQARSIEVFGELELAWRLRGSEPAQWLMVTGTNGKTTTVRMLESMLRAAGLRALAVGNVGVPVIDAVMADGSYDVLAVEASSFQLHQSRSLAPRAGVLLNLAEDHLDWHGSMTAYAKAKAAVLAGEIAVGNADDAAVMTLLDAAPAPRRVVFTLDDRAGAFAVHDGLLVDDAGRVLLDATEVRPSGRHNVANALAAAALAAAVGVGPADVRAGLLQFEPDPHRNQFVAAVAGIDYVDDSKATNPHAAAGSLAAYPRVVWIAGGQLKGASVDELITRFASALVGVVLLGVDRAVLQAALTRHAPDVPVIVIDSTDDGVMSDVVRAATSLARAGDVVLLAPAAASKDMFVSYGQRGSLFADAVAQLASVAEQS